MTAPTTRAASFTARTPDDLLALVPVVLGFVPRDSIAMLTFGGQPPLPRARRPPPQDRPPTCRPWSSCCSARRCGTGCAGWCCSPTPRRRATSTWRPRPELRRSFEGSGIGRPGDPAGGRRPLVAARAGRGRPGCRTGASRTTSAPTRSAPQAVLEGRAHASRAALAASLERDPARVGDPGAAAGSWRALAGRPRRPRPGSPPRSRGTVRDGTVPDDVEAARLLRAAARSGRPGRRLVRVTGATAAAHVALWTDVVRRSPEPLLPGPAAVLRASPPGSPGTARWRGARSTAAPSRTPDHRWPPCRTAVRAVPPSSATVPPRPLGRAGRSGPVTRHAWPRDRARVRAAHGAQTSVSRRSCSSSTPTPATSRRPRARVLKESSPQHGRGRRRPAPRPTTWTRNCSATSWRPAPTRAADSPHWCAQLVAARRDRGRGGPGRRAGDGGVRDGPAGRRPDRRDAQRPLPRHGRHLRRDRPRRRHLRHACARRDRVGRVGRRRSSTGSRPGCRCCWRSARTRRTPRAATPATPPGAPRSGPAGPARGRPSSSGRSSRLPGAVPRPAGVGGRPRPRDALLRRPPLGPPAHRGDPGLRHLHRPRRGGRRSRRWPRPGRDARPAPLAGRRGPRAGGPRRCAARTGAPPATGWPTPGAPGARHAGPAREVLAALVAGRRAALAEAGDLSAGAPGSGAGARR